MRSDSVVRCSLVLLLAISAAKAQQAGPPSEMKSPADATSQTHPTAPPASTPTEQPAAPELAPVTDPIKSAEPAKGTASAGDEKIPTTTIYPQPNAKTVLAPSLDPGPLPKNQSALIGGTVKDIDQIRNRMTVQIFKGSKMTVQFDPRTRFDRNGTPADQSAVKKGDHVYVDTQLVNHKIFARDVYVRTAGVADATGQVTYYNPKTRELTINDQMSQSQVTVRLSPNAVIKTRDAAGSTSDLQYFALVSVHLSPAEKGRNIANEVDVIAKPGNQFTFFGTLTHVDLRSGILAVDNKSDHKLYDLRFDPAQVGVTEDLRVGREVAVNATFNGRDYTVRTLTVTPAAPGKPE